MEEGGLLEPKLTLCHIVPCAGAHAVCAGTRLVVTVCGCSCRLMISLQRARWAAALAPVAAAPAVAAPAPARRLMLTVPWLQISSTEYLLDCWSLGELVVNRMQGLHGIRHGDT